MYDNAVLVDNLFIQNIIMNLINYGPNEELNTENLKGPKWNQGFRNWMNVPVAGIFFFLQTKAILGMYLCRFDCKQPNKFWNYRPNHLKWLLWRKSQNSQRNRKRKTTNTIGKGISCYGSWYMFFFDVEVFDQSKCYRLASKISTAEELFSVVSV